MHRLLMFSALVTVLLALAVPVYADQPTAPAGDKAVQETHGTAVAEAAPVVKDYSTARAEVVDGAVPENPGSLSRDDWKFDTTPYPPGMGLAGHIQT